MTRSQQATVIALVREVLPRSILGIYLHGSAAVGTLRPTSDLDLLIVTSRRTSDAERRALITRLLAVSGPGDPTGRARSIDLAVVVRDDVRPWRYPARLDFQYGDWFRPAYARGDLAPWHPADPDLVVVLAMVLQADRPLSGPWPAELFGPIPWRDVCRAMSDAVPELLTYLDGDERNVVLTFARIWASLLTGRFLSKDEAADWAVARLPPDHRPVLAHARDLYVRGIAAEDWGDLMRRVRPCVDHMVREIARSRPAGEAPCR